MAKPSDGRRILRFEKSLRQELSSFLLTGFKHDLPGMVSISRIIATKDLRNAKIYLSGMGSEAEQKQAAEVLTHFRHEVQHHLARTLDLRFTPRLTFYVDEAAERMLNVDRILMDLERKHQTEI